MTWLEARSDPLQLTRKWLRADGDELIEIYHPKLVGFGNVLKIFRSRITDSIQSSCRITLAF